MDWHFLFDWLLLSFILIKLFNPAHEPLFEQNLFAKSKQNANREIVKSVLKSVLSEYLLQLWS